MFYDMILNIKKGKEFYAKIGLDREENLAILKAQELATRFPESEGFTLELYRWKTKGERVDFRSANLDAYKKWKELD